MLKRTIAGIFVAGLFVGTAQAQFIPGSSGTYRPFGKVEYTFSPSAAQLAAEKSTGSFLPGNSGVYRPFGKVEYLFNQNPNSAGQRVASTGTAFPSAWTQWLD